MGAARPPPRQGRWARSALYPFGGPAMGFSLAGPCGVGLGLRALWWFACVAPPGWGCPFLGLLLALPLFPLPSPLPPPFLFVLFFSSSSARPVCLFFSSVCGPGCLGPWRFVFLPPPPACGFFCLRPLCLWLSLVSGPGCPGPWRCVLFVLLASCFSALRALSPRLCFLAGRWLLPGGCCRPPPLSCLAVFVAASRCSVFIFVVRPRWLWLLQVSGPGCPWPWRCVLFVLLASRFSTRCVLSSLFCFLPGCGLHRAVCCPPTPPFCVARFSSLCAPIFSGFFWFPAPGALGLGAVRCLFPARLVGVPRVSLRPASCRVVLRSVVCFVLCLVLCGALVSVWILAACCGAFCCAVFVVLCCRALLRSLLVFFSWSLAFPWCSGLFPFLCSACAVRCRCACGVAFCALLSSPCGAGWYFVSLSVVFACLLLGLAVLCCLLLGAGGSWCRVLVVCCGVSLGTVLRRVAACRAACRYVVVRCVDLFCSAWCCCALCCLLRRCPSSCGPVSSALCFVLSRRATCVLLWCVAAWCCALCLVRPGVSCCVFPFLSALCGVAVVPCSPLVPCPPVLCPVVLCCRVVLLCPVLLP